MDQTHTREFGPIISCPFADELAYTHRPGPEGPYFCGACGNTLPEHDDA